MFIKVTPKKDGDRIYKTASLVEGYRDKEKGYVRHKVLMYFGSVNDEEIKKLKFVYNKGVAVDKLVSIDRIEIGQVKPYGDVYVLKYLWDWWGLGEKIEELIKDKRCFGR